MPNMANCLSPSRNRIRRNWINERYRDAHPRILTTGKPNRRAQLRQPKRTKVSATGEDAYAQEIIALALEHQSAHLRKRHALCAGSLPRP